MVRGLRVAALVLIGVALLLLLASNVPQVSFSQDRTGGCTTRIAMWGEHASGSGCTTDFRSWFSGENKGRDGIALLRMAGPLLAATSALAVVATVLLAAGKTRAAAIFGFVTTGMTALTVTLTALGESDLDAGGNLDFFLAFYFLCGAGLVAMVGSVLAMLERPAPAGMGQRPAPGGPRTFGTGGKPSAPAPAPSGGRPGRCPRCKSPVTLFKGVKPSCSACGFKA
ncbi:MAG TPA: hypothetical protein VI796_06085 [Candidatus Thermoplasmatota archaeon]|nr:hypothetical protein [Candidatus Thermoplasmatota archaeon]